MTDSKTLSGIDLASLGIAKPTATAASKDLGQADFLKLMLTQLRNQDPLKPQEGGEFIAQMAQFGTVDGIRELQDSFSSLSDALQSYQALQASSLVGRSVQVESAAGELPKTGALTGSVELASSASNVNIQIFNQQGELVKSIDLGNKPGGKVDFSWDGTASDGSKAAPGVYAIKAEALVGTDKVNLPTLVTANVESVVLNKEKGDLILNLSGLGSISMTQVKQIN